MRLYYTTTSRVDTPQQKANQSLGGFKSSSLVPNSSFGSLFSDISSLFIERDLPEYIGIILINELESECTDIKLWINRDIDSICKYKVSVVELNSRNEMEMLPSINSKPLYAEFYDANSIDNAINIPPMLPNEQYGIWIERSLDKESSNYVNRGNCEVLYNNPNIFDNKIEEFEVKIQFNG